MEMVTAMALEMAMVTAAAETATAAAMGTATATAAETGMETTEMAMAMVGQTVSPFHFSVAPFLDKPCLPGVVSSFGADADVR